MVKEAIAPIDLESLKGVSSTAMPKKLFELLAPIMGWSWPKGRTIFSPTIGRGKDVRPKPTVRSHVQGMINNQLTDLNSKRGGHIVIQKEFRTPVPSLEGGVNFNLNGETFWMSYGAAVKYKKNDEGSLEPDTSQNFPMIHARKVADNKDNVGCIVVEPHQKELFAYLMLHPVCSMSPFQMTAEEMERTGIRMTQAGTDLVRTPHMTPNNIIRTEEERDARTREDIDLLVALSRMGEAELLLLVEKVRVSVNTNSSNVTASILARFKELIDAKDSTPAHKEKYARLKSEVRGNYDSKDAAGVLVEALKYGVLRKDSSVWYHNNKMVPFSVMDDLTSGSVAVAGDEINWFANRITMCGYGDWLDMIEQETDVAADEKRSQMSGRSGPGTKHHVLSEAIAEGLILGYDKTKKQDDGKPDKNYRWKSNNQAVCYAKRWGSDENEKKLKDFMDDLMEHFRDWSVEDVIEIVEKNR